MSTLDGGVLKRLTAFPSGAGKRSESTLEGGASRVRVTSSDDFRVGRIACPGSPSLSHPFCGRCDGVMDIVRDLNLLGNSVPQVRASARTLALSGFFLIISSDSLLLSI